MARPIVFDETHPLQIVIEKDANGFWDIHPKNASDVATMNARAAADLPNIDNEWQGRRSGGAPPRPHFKLHPGHTPIVIREEEFIEFSCNPAFGFAIFVGRDSNVAAYATAPSDMFAWHVPISVAPGSTKLGKVQGIVNGVGPREQRFYKFSAWVYDETAGQPPETVIVDPDGFCDR